ncbi:SH3 domain-containing protein, partial [Salmonella enterica subsp. enterica serovar Bijlmer]|nr:SH3 domain-containing protein [Salmonella enterica subsp. enterica serovar Bijlmer]
MMKEKKTSLTNNENEFDITVFPSIVEKSKYQDSLLASSTDASKALEALTKNSGVDALLNNHDSLFAGTTATSKACEAMTRNSVTNTFLKNHDSLFAGSTATSKAFE